MDEDDREEGAEDGAGEEIAEAGPHDGEAPDQPAGGEEGQEGGEGVDRQDPSLLLIFKCVSKQIHSRLSIFMFRVTSVASCIDTL